MKTYKKTLVFIATLIITNITPNKISAQELSGSINISGAFALYPITVKWAEEFKKTHPKVKIDIQAGGAGKGITDVLSKVTDIGLVSRDLNDAEYKKKAFAIAVTKDAVIPTISAASPYKAVLYKRGIKKEALNNIFITGKYKTWNALGFKNTAAIHVYTRSDAAGAAETWAHYFGKKQEDLQGVAVFGDPGLAEAVKRDPSGLGFNNIVYIYDTKTNKPTNGLVPVPIDLNNNGKLDPDENFYNDIDQLIAAIVAGKYPSPPARDLYFVTNGKPNNPIVKAFLKFILTDGQKYVTEAGYIKLSKDKLKKELDKVK
ncbi:PstS family phosphate ABC transporter substrate-binding protein [Flavobacterium sp. HJJ]|uniref:PstS family phosphate ABC transporter substrate-binding protein n=1 Tax=Flavobacterium sp. HJJ TaxID=2783792 RepID=UPI00188B5AF5|nr:substrate-binding domain-containing protein [Flavobacterium sp. HJJ]MBF4473436.1 extracellular solute-binding protein [Flavobacterium sp. HJJ]